MEIELLTTGGQEGEIDLQALVGGRPASVAAEEGEASKNGEGDGAAGGREGEGEVGRRGGGEGRGSTEERAAAHEYERPAPIRASRWADEVASPDDAEAEAQERGSPDLGAGQPKRKRRGGGQKAQAAAAGRGGGGLPETAEYAGGGRGGDANGRRQNGAEEGGAASARGEEGGRDGAGARARAQAQAEEEEEEEGGGSDDSRELNRRELQELEDGPEGSSGADDQQEQRPEEEEEEDDDDGEEEEEEEARRRRGRLLRGGVHAGRAIDMLQGCRSVDNFERLNRIDEGTYGVVYRARDRGTGEVVALKKVKMDKEREGFPLTSLREINILLSFHHASIVDVKEVVVGNNLDSIFMVMEYMEHDVKSLMESMKQPFSQSEVKCLMLQLLSGTKYLHDNWVLHRDLKTSNLLLNNNGEIKICDFGLSRQYGSPLKAYTHMVVTLWYRCVRESERGPPLPLPLPLPLPHRRHSGQAVGPPVRPGSKGRAASRRDYSV
eukprot:jgi/Mesen1/6635/ME000034S06089